MCSYQALALAAVTVAALGVSTTSAQAACSDRKAVGTVIGGIGGALLGNSISRGGGGAIVGGLGGAVIGHEIGRAGCRRSVSSAGYRYRSASAPRAAAPQPVRYVYYDQYGNPVSSGAVPARTAAAAPLNPQQGYSQASYTAACRTETRAFYDERGALIYRPVQICAR